MTPSGEPITKCPVCRYDLTGLPRNHRCPECGFEYDETMMIWRGSTSSPYAKGMVIGQVVLGAAILVGLLLTLNSLAKSSWFVITIAPAAMLGLALRYGVVRRMSSFVVVSDRLLLVKLPGRKPRRIEWNQVDLSRSDGYPQEISGTRTRVLRLPMLQMGILEHKALLREIRVRHARLVMPLDPSGRDV